MRLLVDENLPRSMVNRLRDAEHDVACVADGWPGLADRDVIAVAREQRRILIPLDRDFGELIFRRLYASPPGVMYLRKRGANTRSVLADAIEFLLGVDDGALTGMFVVVTNRGVRSRPLPSE